MTDTSDSANSASVQATSSMDTSALDAYAGQPVWVTWRDVKGRKVPYSPLGDGWTKARSNDPRTWGTLQEARKACLAGRCSGIGLMLGDGRAGVDLDVCIKKDGSLEPWAREILDCVDAYAEVSPSGRGLKIFFRHAGLDLKDWQGKILMGPRKDGKTPAVEMFCDGRYFTVTGLVFEDYDELVEVPIEALEQVRAIAERHAPAAPKRRSSKEWTEPGDMALDMVASALAAVPFEDPMQMPRDLWIELGLALKRYGDTALPVWLAACARYPNDSPDEDMEVWEGLKPHEGGVTARSILHLAQQHGWSVARYQSETAAKIAEKAPEIGKALGLRKDDLIDIHTPALTDYLAYLPNHDYIYLPTGMHHPLAAVNATVAHLPAADGKTIKPSSWLDNNAPIHGKTWAPGFPVVIRGRGIDKSGWFEHAGVNTYNEYRPPVLKRGNAGKAGWWVELVSSVYPDDADHIMAWLAHRVQRPGEKINHGLVLLGSPGIGKDSILEPARRAVGEWNFKEIAPHRLLNDQFTPYRKAVILRVSEAQDQGELNRYQLYERCKVLMAAPPMSLDCNEKHVKEQYVLNVVGVIITSNHTHNGLYLPADDRRHYVANSERKQEDRGKEYWDSLWHWYEASGFEDVHAWLAEHDLSSFNASAPPRKTPAFWNLVNSERSDEDIDLDETLDKMGRPPAVTLDMLRRHAGLGLIQWFDDRRNRRQIPHRLERTGYVPVPNPGAKDNLWVLKNRRQIVYGSKELSGRERLAAVTMLTNASDEDPSTQPPGSNITKLPRR